MKRIILSGHGNKGRGVAGKVRGRSRGGLPKGGGGRIIGGGEVMRFASEAIMYRVTTGMPLTVTVRSYCGYGALGTFTGRSGESSSPATAIHLRGSRASCPRTARATWYARSRASRMAYRTLSCVASGH